MSLSIVAVKDMDQAFEILSARSRKVVRDRQAKELEEIGRFSYDFQAAFTNYACYYRFDPYMDTYLEIDQVPAIKAFSESIITWLEKRGAEENNIIQQYSVPFKKIRSFAVDLGYVCDAAMERGYGLLGIGD